jgi:tellurite resistance protein
MGRGAQVAGFLRTLISDYQVQMQRHRNRPFLEATMAACALVAVADGEVTFGERIRVDQILGALETLKVFDPHEAVDIFNQYAEGILSSPRQGRERAIEALRPVSEDPEKSALLMRIFLAICEVNGEGGSLVKQIEVVMLCSLLGIEPKDCGLYIDGGQKDLLNP